MAIWEIILLAVVQGVTEFLPVSSSGHLALLQHALGIEEAQFLLAVVLHAGTLMSIIVYYRQQLIALAKLQDRQTSLKVIGATIPVVIIGLGLHDIIKEAFASYWVAVVGLAITSFILLVIHRDGKGGTELHDMTWKQAMLTGLAQCVAITPGISRSGTTISIASRLGVAPAGAAAFSFLLAVPAILGACVLELKSWHDNGGGGVQPVIFITGFLVSFAVGLVSLHFLIRMLNRGHFRYFGYYCLFASALAAILKVTN